MEDKVYESFHGDLNATCIFKLSAKEYENLISKIENNTNFECNVKKGKHMMNEINF